MPPHIPGTLPLVKIGTENDEYPPLIIEDPCCHPFGPDFDDRSDFRTATEDEYRRYTEHYAKEE